MKKILAFISVRMILCDSSCVTNVTGIISPAIFSKYIKSFFLHFHFTILFLSVTSD